MALELIKENIECEQLLGENFADTVIKAEYVIPDTQPDVDEILMLDVKPFITSKEVLQDKVYVEGQIEYNILYLAKEDEKYGTYNLNYTGKFSNSVDIEGAMHKMACEAYCYIEHMECSILNERKISVGGIVKLKSEVYKNYDFQIVKDVNGADNMQFLKSPAALDKVVQSLDGELFVKSHMLVPMDKPQVGKILKYDIIPHKKETKMLEGKIQVSAFARVEFLYRGKDTTEVCYLEDDVLVSAELEANDINPSMDSYTDLKVDSVELNLKDDDLGESRVIDVEALIKSNTKIMFREEIETIEDAYSPTQILNMDRKDYELNIMQGHANAENIVKGNIETTSEMPKPSEIIMCSGNVCVTDKKLVDDKVVVDGLLNVNVIYKTNDEGKNIYTVSDDIPFSSSVEVPGTRIDMQGIARVFLESVEASLEANTVAVKAVVQTYVRVNYSRHKEFLVDITPVEGETPSQKASMTIYVVQQDDTLWKIAKKYYTTMDNIVKINEIENPDSLLTGSKLIIPGRALI